MATYSGTAISPSMVPSSPQILQMISPQAALSASRQVSLAKNSWEGWWSMARPMRPLYPAALSGSRFSVATSVLTTVSGAKPSGAVSPSR